MSEINCQSNMGRACGAGLNAGHCGEGFALRCRARLPRDAEQPAVIRVVVASVTPRPMIAGPGEVDICAERVNDEWQGEWRERVRAAIIRTVGARVVLPWAVYAEALTHRAR